MKIEIGDVLNNRYEIKEVIMIGSFCVIFRAHDHQQRCNVAVKQLQKSNIDENTAKGLIVLMQLNHDNIVRQFSVFEDIDYYYQVVEYLIPFEKYRLILMQKDFMRSQKMYLSLLKNSLVDSILALKYLSHNQLILSNIDSSSIMISVNNTYISAKLTGFSQISSPNQFFSPLLSKNQQFLPPECIISDIFLKKCPKLSDPNLLLPRLSQSHDVWSVGTVFYRLFLDDPSLINLASSGSGQKGENKGGFDLNFDSIPEDIKDVLKKMLEKDEQKRDNFIHDIFQDQNFIKLMKERGLSDLEIHVFSNEVQIDIDKNLTDELTNVVMNETDVFIKRQRLTQDELNKIISARQTSQQKADTDIKSIINESTKKKPKVIEFLNDADIYKIQNAVEDIGTIQLRVTAHKAGQKNKK